jgi:1-phosphatidylinositol-3-phosphate 5-kinase
VPVVHSVPSHFRRRVISKEFWMKDENAKDCFNCGQSFSTFRRKHHCRTCGQIFDARCTSLVSARPFGQPGTLRLCKPCEEIILGSADDDSSVYSEDGAESLRTPHARRPTPEHVHFSGTIDEVSNSLPSAGEVMTPFIGIPASRRNREAKRRSAVIEFDAGHTLARPSSSRSLVSLSARPRSSSHKRHQSRQSFLRGRDDRAPFHQEALGEPETKQRSITIISSILTSRHICQTMALNSRSRTVFSPLSRPKGPCPHQAIVSAWASVAYLHLL